MTLGRPWDYGPELEPSMVGERREWDGSLRRPPDTYCWLEFVVMGALERPGGGGAGRLRPDGGLSEPVRLSQVAMGRVLRYGGHSNHRTPRAQWPFGVPIR